jgi:5-methylthioribose kinase
MSQGGADLDAFLVEQGLAEPGEEGIWIPLTGGVSSDIWRVETRSGSYCVKRALAKLKVAAHWEAPIERNAFEWAYMEVASTAAPGCVPRLIAHDVQRGLFAMEWLAPEQYPLWKAELLEGRADPDFAATVGDLLGRIHSATASDPSLPSRFATDANFHALRVDPYLLETARRHPDLAGAIEAIASRTAETKLALVHGDVSPKNILVGPTGPVLLDAEVAWFGDPAFDLAFCLNHLVIKARVVEQSASALKSSFRRLAAHYLGHVDWEEPKALEERAAALLPALALARVDGKSPLEYLDEEQRQSLRADARAAVRASPRSLEQARRLLRPV